MATKVLFIGGTGTISTACSALAVQQGIELYLLNRGQTTDRRAPKEARSLQADIRQPDTVRKALDGLHFDCVVDWVAFTPEHIDTDIQLFTGITSQFIFISTAMVYHKPGLLPVTESTYRGNPHSKYASDKIICEDRLVAEHISNGFPSTIVRPSHTYDRTSLPLLGGWTIMDRMLKGKLIPVHGDGTSLWTVTHARDFALGFNGLLGNSSAVGEAFHITSNEAPTWNMIFETFAEALGVKPKIVHVPSDTLTSHEPSWEGQLIADRAHSAVFDNSKIKRFVPSFNPVVPFSAGVREIVEWRLADASRQQLEPETDALLERIVVAQQRAFAS